MKIRTIHYRLALIFAKAYGSIHKGVVVGTLASAAVRTKFRATMAAVGTSSHLRLCDHNVLQL